MAGRAAGAILALVAAVAFAGALASSLPVPWVVQHVPAWWDGHPRVDGRVIDRKDIHVSLATAQGCNLGETVDCRAIEIDDVVKLAGRIEVVLIALAGIFALALAVSAWQLGEHRKLLATIARIALLLAAAGAGALAVLGPDVHASQHVEVPIGAGFVLCGVGVLATAIASVVVPRLSAEPLRLKTAPVRVPAAAVPAAAVRDEVDAFDVDALLREPVAPPSRPTPARFSVGYLASLPPEPPVRVSPPPAPAPPPPFEVPSLVVASANPQLRDDDTIDRGLTTRRARESMDPTAVRPSTIADAPPTDLPPPKVAPLPTASARTKAASAAPPPRTTAPRGVVALPPSAARPSPAPGVPVPGDPIPRAPIPRVPIPGVPSTLPGVPAATLPGMPPMPPATRPSRPPPSRLPHDTDESPTVKPPVMDHSGTDVDGNPDATSDAPSDAPAASDPRAHTEPLTDLSPALRAGTDVSPVPAPPPAPSAAVVVPLSTAPISLPPPTSIAEQTNDPTPGCPQCEAPMAWVDEHLRFYCKQCRMYF